MTQLKCAIIGCGPGTEGRGGVHSISYAHGWAFRSDPRTELVGAASRTAKNRDDFAIEFPGTRMYEGYAEMLRQEKPDLVSICAFPRDREIMVNASLEAGAKVLWVEKPFALSLGEAHRIHNAATAAKARIFVNHQRRMGKVFEWFRNAVISGELGELYSVTIVQPGPEILEFGPHLIDTALSVLGDRKPKTIFAAVDMSRPLLNKGNKSERNLIGTVTYEGGVSLHLQTGEMGANSPILRADGSLGFAELHVSHTSGMKSVFRMVSSARAGLHNPEAQEHFHHGLADGQLFYDRALTLVLNAVKSGQPSGLDVEEAIKGVELTVGAFESARLGKPLTFPIQQQSFPLDLAWPQYPS